MLRNFLPQFLFLLNDGANQIGSFAKRRKLNWGGTLSKLMQRSTIGQIEFLLASNSWNIEDPQKYFKSIILYISNIYD
jgi:hypothetical protein